MQGRAVGARGGGSADQWVGVQPIRPWIVCVQPGASSDLISMQTSRCVFSVPRTCQWVGIGACTAVVRVCVLAWRRVVVRAAARCYGLVLRVRVKGQSKGRGKGQRKGFCPSA